MYQMDRGFGKQEIEHGETVSPGIYKDRVEVKRKQAKGSCRKSNIKVNVHSLPWTTSVSEVKTQYLLCHSYFKVLEHEVFCSNQMSEIKPPHFYIRLSYLVIIFSSPLLFFIILC